MGLCCLGCAGFIVYCVTVEFALYFLFEWSVYMLDYYSCYDLSVLGVVI